MAARLWALWLVLLGAAVTTSASGAGRVHFKNLNDGGVLLLEPDGGVFLGQDGGPVIVPIAPSSRCEADAGALLDALKRERCIRSRDCVVRELDLLHQAIPSCMAATAEAWRSDAVQALINALGRECGFETRYPRDSCPAPSCRGGLCVLNGGDSP